MNCKNASANLSAYVDRELGLDFATQIEGHLQVCPWCRHEETELRKLKQLLESSACPDLDPAFEMRLQRWLESPEMSRPASSMAKTVSLWLLAPAAALILWLTLESVSVDAKQPMARPTQDVAGNLVRDQVDDLTTGQPQYGAPVAKAADYAR